MSGMMFRFKRYMKMNINFRILLIAIKEVVLWGSLLLSLTLGAIILCLLMIKYLGKDGIPIALMLSGIIVVIVSRYKTLVAIDAEEKKRILETLKR